MAYYRNPSINLSSGYYHINGPPSQSSQLIRIDQQGNPLQRPFAQNRMVTAHPANQAVNGLNSHPHRHISSNFSSELASATVHQRHPILTKQSVLSPASDQCGSSPYPATDMPPSPYYEEVVVASPFGSRPGSVDSVALEMRSPAYYPSQVSEMGLSEQSYVVPDIHRAQETPNPFAPIEDSAEVVIKRIAAALEKSYEVRDPRPLTLSRFMSSPQDLDLPEVTLNDVMEVIEKDIQETYMQKHVPILPVVVEQKVPNTVRQLMQQPPDLAKAIDFSAPTKRGSKSKPAEKRFQCIACRKQFAGGSHLKNHFKTAVHKNEVTAHHMTDPVNLPETWRIEEQLCGVCGLTFSSKELLQKHMGMAHADPAPHLPLI